MRNASRVLAASGVILVLVIVGYVFVLKNTITTRTKSEDNEKLVIAATIFPLYDLARQVAGDDAKAILVLPPGASPHTFEPLPTIVRQLESADVLFVVGLGLDDWATGLVGPDTTIIRIGPDENNGLRCKDGICDPHFWMSPKIATLMADGIRATLMNTDRAHLAEYDERGRTLMTSVATLDTEIKTTLASVSNRHILTFHDAFEYFANDYDLDIVGTFEPSPGREPSAQDLARLNKLVREFNIKTVYTEPQSSSAGIQAFISDLNLDVRALDDLGGVPGRETYQDLIRYNANTIAS